MKYKEAPCKDCIDRHVGCHNETCPHGWLEYKKERDELLNDKKRKNDLMCDLIELRREGIKAVRKGRKS